MMLTSSRDASSPQTLARCYIMTQQNRCVTIAKHPNVNGVDRKSCRARFKAVERWTAVGIAELGSSNPLFELAQFVECLVKGQLS